MADKQNTLEKEGLSGSIWPLVVLCLFFGVLLILQPDLIWQLAVGFVICFAGLGIYLRTQENAAPERVADIEKNEVSGSDLHSIIDAMQFPAYLIDGNVNVRYSNSHAARVFGATRAGEKITIRFRQPQLRQAIENVLASQIPLITDYNEPVPDDRSFKLAISPIELQADAARRNGGHFLMTFHDQTEAHRMDQMRSDFIANASHELRTPLASLLGYLETIKGSAKNDPEAQKRFHDVMLDQAERMSRLVNDLLSLSRIEMKSHVRPSDTVDMSEVLQSVVSSLDALSKQMNVTIELDADEKLSVVGDRDELVQVFENLIENACKYGQEGERVVVNLRRTDEFGGPFATISVQDFGIGIAAEHQQRITERFYRVDVALSRAKQGTGLGLAIVKHILNRHGSRMLVNSSPGQGTEITVKLKLANQGDC